MTTRDERAAAEARIEVAFEAWRHRPYPDGNPLEVARQRERQATDAVCMLIGRIEAVVASEFAEVTAERVAQAVEQAVASALGQPEHVKKIDRSAPPAI